MIFDIMMTCSNPQQRITQMAATRQPANPFYVILVVVGILFLVTASAYGVMTVKQLHGQLDQDQPAAGERFLRLLDQYGGALLLGELAVLGLVTVAAIGTDEYWSRLAVKRTNKLTENRKSSLPVKQEKRT